MNGIRIIGISLLRNEDLFVERALRNAVDFCDRLIVADNGSRDGTWDIVQRLAAQDERVECHRIGDPARSHDLIKGFAATDTWIFGVDGDEIYDPSGLRVLRRDILAGRHQDQWKIVGNVLHCTELDVDGAVAKGHLSPPSRSMTKLYNFGAFASWDGECPERLHGGRPVLRPGFDQSATLGLHRRYPWEESPFRCLHLCFLRRSSTERPGGVLRPNIMEQRAMGWWGKIGLRRARAGAGYKQANYARGEIVTRDVRPFFI